MGATLIDGEGTTWSAGNVTVGNGFDHTLTISGGAAVATQSFFIANVSTGEVVLTDAGSTLTTNGKIFVVGGFGQRGDDDSEWGGGDDGGCVSGWL